MARQKWECVDVDTESVRAVLRDWDPIGVFPNWESCPARDEYDSYAPQLLSMLYANKSLAEIADRLESLRTRDMHLPTRRDRDEAVANQLLQLNLQNPRRAGER